MTATAIIRAGTEIPCRPWPRYVLTRDAWAAMARALEQQAKLTLVTLWADTTHAHALFMEREQEEILLASVRATEEGFPALSPFRRAHPVRIRDLAVSSRSGAMRLLR